MKLSAPTVPVFLISLIIVIVGLIATLGVIPPLPFASVWIILAGYIVLAAGSLLKGA